MARSLWKSDAAAGTVMIKDIDTGSTGSDPNQFTNVNGEVYFTSNDGSHGEELWKSNGTAAGTVMVKDINPGGTSSNPEDLTNVNGTLYFAADDGTHGVEYGSRMRRPAPSWSRTLSRARELPAFET